MAGAIKPLSIFLACGVMANAYLAWEIHTRLPPSTADLEQDLAKLAEQPYAAPSDDPQIRAEEELGEAVRSQTRNMLEQRRHAALRFIDVRYTVNGAPVAPADRIHLKELEADISNQMEIVKAAETSADEVIGGSIHAQRLANLRMAQTTLALLQRRYLAAKHAITLPLVSQRVLPVVDKDVLDAIEADIAERRRAVMEAREEADQYVGGLIRAILLSRQATEQATLSALEQRFLTLKHGLPPVPGSVLVTANIADPEALAGIEADIASTRASIAEAELEASRYSGGLIYVTILSRIATEKSTLAMLEQRRLSIKHNVMNTPPSQGSDVIAPKEPPGTIVNDKEAL